MVHFIQMQKTEGLKALYKYNSMQLLAVHAEMKKNLVQRTDFSFRTAEHRWEQEQRPELWSLIIPLKKMVRACEFSSFKLDGIRYLQYIFLEQIDIVPLYFLPCVRQ